MFHLAWFWIYQKQMHRMKFLKIVEIDEEEI